MSWHPFIAGELYEKDDVVAECLDYIVRKKVANPDEKRRYVDAINRSPYNLIKWYPISHKGWGASPMNPECWLTEGDQKIWNKEILSSKSMRF